MQQPTSSPLATAILIVAGALLGMFLIHHGLLGPVAEKHRAFAYLIGAYFGGVLGNLIAGFLRR